jgi:hypothetical protein
MYHSDCLKPWLESVRAVCLTSKSSVPYRFSCVCSITRARFVAQSCRPRTRSTIDVNTLCDSMGVSGWRVEGRASQRISDTCSCLHTSFFICQHQLRTALLRFGDAKVGFMGTSCKSVHAEQTRTRCRGAVLQRPRSVPLLLESCWLETLLTLMPTRLRSQTALLVHVGNIPAQRRGTRAETRKRVTRRWTACEETVHEPVSES